MTNRNASATLFGWDFQINAAIVLMLENIKVADKVRVEGETQDIEITLNNGMKIYAQAKSVEKSSTDFSNVRKNMEDSIQSLSEAYAQGDADKLIFVTNSPNPFGNNLSRSIFFGDTTRVYDDIPENCKNTINKYIEKLGVKESFDLGKYQIRVIPFETDNLNERYKVIRNKVNEFLFELQLGEVGMGQKLLDVWQKVLFENATMSNMDKTLKKEDIIWPLIVLSTNVQQCNSDFFDVIDDCDYEEIIHKYEAFINNRIERFEFVTRVISDYTQFTIGRGNSKEITNNFINEKWKEYLDDFEGTSFEDDIKKTIIKVILYTILKQRRTISRIKKEVNI